jgi:hypothetical protein
MKQLVLLLAAGLTLWTSPAQAQQQFILDTNYIDLPDVDITQLQPTTAESQIGNGAWQASGDAKEGEFYFAANGGIEGLSFTVDEIERITYHTKKDAPEGAPDFYLLIYTEPDGEDDDSWYGYRLNAEPYYSNSLNAPANQWNRWSTEDGTNQLTFFDANRSGVGFGFYGAPTLADLQNGPINWSDEKSGAEDREIDYGAETVEFLNISTGNPWANGFTGYLDAIEVELTDGTTVTYDLEEAAPAAVSPVLECVTDNGDGTYTASFGYNNQNAATVFIPVGSGNRFTGTQDRGQSVAFAPGRTVDAFTVDFDGSNLVWTLRSANGSQRTATASSSSERCAPTVDGNDISPIAECVIEELDGTLTANFGYENNYGEKVRVPQGGDNKITPSAFDGPQPIYFIMPNIYDGRPGRTLIDAGVFSINFDPDQVSDVVWTLGNSTATASAATKRCPCEPSQLTSEVFNNADRRVEITIEDPEGIRTANFTMLENLSVQLVSATNTSGSVDFSRDDPNSDVGWSADDPDNLPTTLSFYLNQKDANIPEAGYYVDVDNGCGTQTVIDPPLEFELSHTLQFALEGSYPNPTRGAATVSFSLDETGPVQLAVYDVMGRKVATLVDQDLPPGTHEVVWQGRGRSGQALASGVYFVRLEAGERTATRRLTIVR